MFFVGYVPLLVIVALAMALLLVVWRSPLVVRLIAGAAPGYLAVILVRDAATTTESLGVLLWPPALLLTAVVLACLVLGGRPRRDDEPPVAAGS
ncbi:hypothetical protein [Brevundimonas viscosa]|uniref:Uncharacterized protein n=1 Tax=Brevundimonas viscosa TaxID=871741 RepID=A0A1I6PB02_9CAUL|nr:hypothetical protein [Brevundimonas viscosa]SFS37384.1 hypothetical protein SAMN05192570_0998 [Brevundimonas viscosa]